MNKSFVSVFAGCALLAAAGVYTAQKAFAQDGSETATTQTYKANRYAIIAGKLDVATQTDGNPYTMNAMVLLDTQTGQTWMMQSMVEQSNDPVVLSAAFVPVELSNTPLPPVNYDHNAAMEGDITTNAQGITEPMGQGIRKDPNAAMDGDITPNAQGITGMGELQPAPENVTPTMENMGM